MSKNYDAVYIDLDTGKKLFLDRPVNSPYKQLKYQQDEPAAIWTIFHQQNMSSFVTVFFDADSNEIKPSKYYMHDGTTSVAEFEAPMAGHALLIFFEGVYIPPPSPSVTPTSSVTPTPLVSITPSHSGVWLTPTASATPTLTNSPTPTLTPTSTPGSFNQPFDYALIRYTWNANDGNDLDTRTAIITPDRGAEVGWSRGDSDGVYLTWGGDNTTPSGPEAVLVDFNSLSTAYPDLDQFVIRLRLNWYGTRVDGNVGVVFESYVGGTMQHVGTDFTNVGGALVNSATINVNCVSNTAGNVDGSDIGTLVYDSDDKTAQFIPLVPAVTVTPTPTITTTVTLTPSITPTISVTPSITPTISVTPSVSPTISITPSVTPTISVTRSIPASPTPGSYFNDFSSGTNGFSGNWAIKPDSTYGQALESDDIGDSQSTSTTLNFTTIGDSTVSFDYHVSSESGYDFFDFIKDGTNLLHVSGQLDWQHASYPVTGAGPHSFVWSYSKDSSNSVGTDDVWIANVSIAPVVAVTPTPSPTPSQTPSTGWQALAHRFWRLNVSANNGSNSYVTVAELAFYNDNGSTVNLVNPALAQSYYFESGEANSQNSGGFAFDGDASTKWTSSTTTGYVGWDFGSAQLVRTVGVIGQYSGGDQPLLAPKDFTIEYSDDNTNWTIAATITNQTSWGAGEQRIFALNVIPPTPTPTITVTASVTPPISMTPTPSITVSPLVSNVVSLMRFAGTDGTATFTDEVGNLWSSGAPAKLSNTVGTPFGTGEAGSFIDPSYLQTPHQNNFNISSNDLTVAAWVYAHDMSGLSYASISNVHATNGAESTNLSWLFGLANGKLNISIYSTGGQFSITDSALLNINQWVYVAFVKSGNTITLFNNGSVVGTTTLNGSFYNSTLALSIGHVMRNSGVEPNLGWNGYIGEHVIVKSALYSAKFNVPTSPFPYSSVPPTPTPSPTISITPTTTPNAFMNGPLLHLDGANSSTTITDAHALTTWTVSGAAALSTAQFKFGSSSLAVNSGYVKTTNMSQYFSGDFCIEGWAYATATPRGIFHSNPNSSASGIGFGWDNANNQWALYYNTGAQNSATTTIPTGWFHFAVYQVSGTLYAAINGTAIITITGQNSNTYGSFTTMYFGIYYNNGYPWVGYLDELRITFGASPYKSASFAIPTAPFN